MGIDGAAKVALLAGTFGCASAILAYPGYAGARGWPVGAWFRNPVSLLKVFAILALVAAPVVAVVAGAASFPAMAGADIVGPARVIDGDSLVVAGVKVRLHGVDAFEWDQVCGAPSWTCGRAATAAMRDLVKGRTVVCRGLYRTYDRVAAICHAGGVDLAGELVRRGLAVAVERYSRAYLEVEKGAKAERRGAWSGAFVTPARWRRR